MKYLIVGDVHNHLYMFDDVKKLDNKYNFDRIIFLGDYVDDWETDNLDSWRTLDIVINLKNSNPNKYTFLIGNHELSYLGYPCSGHRKKNEQQITQKLTDNINCFDLYTFVEFQNKHFCCSHAGFTYEYDLDVLNGKVKIGSRGEPILEVLPYLNMISYHRGGIHDYSSFVWADKKELEQTGRGKEIITPYQIVGHTPVHEITIEQHLSKYVDADNIFIFCDTHSTYTNGFPIGDQSYLILDDDKLETIKHKNIK